MAHLPEEARKRTAAAASTTGAASATTAKGARDLLASLTVAGVIPILVFAASALYITADTTRANARREAADTLMRVAERVTAKLAKEIEVAEALAASSSLDQPDLPRFYREAGRIAPTRALWETVALVDLSGKQRLNLLRPLGEDLGPVADRASFEQVLRTQQPSIGGIGPVGSVSGKRLISFAVPVVRKGQLQYVLAVKASAHAVRQVLRNAGAPAGWIGAIVDAQGHIIARSSGQDSGVGPAAVDAIRKATAHAPAGYYQSRTAANVEIETIYRTLAGPSRWSVHFGVPTETLNAPVAASLGFLAAAGLASVVLAIVLVHYTGRDLAQRRQAEAANAALALRMSEAHRALAVEAADLGTWRWDARKGAMSGSERVRALLGLPVTVTDGGHLQWPLEAFVSSMHPADRACFAAALQACGDRGDPINLELRLVQPAGLTRWVKVRGRLPPPGSTEQALLYANSQVVHGVISDIQSRKQAEAERLDLLRRLSEAQENEQRRIARELHDQVGQTVTALSLGLKRLEQSMSANGTSDEAAREQMRWLRGLAVDIGRDIHRAAADLRPTALDDLGLCRAVSAFASEWGARHGIAVEVQSIGLEERLSAEVETAVFRALQEGLTNVLKHASARSVRIALEGCDGELRVVVADDGMGFRPQQAAAPAGLRKESDVRPVRLGLLGIRERLALVGGRMLVDSKPGAGASLRFEIPLA
ncbi:MAG: histidine kinase [Hyphomicrobiaceae bacterium]|nr:histidine kinase [Hyphomicrobiaceae bacterium]